MILKTKFPLIVSFLILGFFVPSVFSQSPDPNGEIFLPFPEKLKLDGSEINETTSPNSNSTGDNTSSSVSSTIVSTGKETGSNTGTTTAASVKNNPPGSSVSSVSATNSGSETSAKPKKKKKGKDDVPDPSEAPFQRGKAFLARNQKKNAETEFTESYSKEGKKVDPSRTENTNLFGLDSKDKEGTGLVEKIEDPDAKIKSQFELARSLDRMNQPESEEKAYKEYLKLVTSFPVHPELTPRTHLAIAVLLFRKQEYRPALHHLVKLIKEFKDSKDRPTAYYYAGRIYESAWVERDLERAKKYYDLYLQESENKELVPGNDFRKDAKERRRLIEVPLGI
ncbi:tetratricopeptide repeat protein [Leptospira kobayashii]|uniref:tetratricopeptide repeat protein n=1 Tax=Leptospira kobayashii TaxID=1917830 RepID=UPI000D59706A|nr:tetratricopeptide repeat protein [Leptospira kobayashii]